MVNTSDFKKPCIYKFVNPNMQTAFSIVPGIDTSYETIQLHKWPIVQPGNTRVM